MEEDADEIAEGRETVGEANDAGDGKDDEACGTVVCDTADGNGGVCGAATAFAGARCSAAAILSSGCAEPVDESIYEYQERVKFEIRDSGTVAELGRVRESVSINTGRDQPEIWGKF